MIILGASIVSLIISIVTKKKWALINLLAGLICGFVGVVDYRDAAEKVASSESRENIFSLHVSMGSGLYLVLIGSALLIIVSIIDVISGDRRKKVDLSPDSLEMNFTTENSVNERKDPGLSAADELKKYKDLLDSGAITQAEYDSVKAKLLNL